MNKPYKAVKEGYRPSLAVAGLVVVGPGAIVIEVLSDAATEGAHLSVRQKGHTYASTESAPGSARNGRHSIRVQPWGADGAVSSPSTAAVPSNSAV